MLKICTIIIHLSLIELILLVVTEATDSEYYNATKNIDTFGSDRLERSPPDELPQKLEAMIIDENGKFIHLKWEKTQQTLFNADLPIWTARRTQWGTYHTLKNNVVKSLWPLVAYHDPEQTSAVLYHAGKIWGAIDINYSIDGIPLNLLHQCHKVGGQYVKIIDHSDQAPIHPQPSISDIERFEGCGDASDNHESPQRREERECSSIQDGVTSIRKRRDQNPEHFYIETLMIVTNDLTQSYKTQYGTKYLTGIVWNYMAQFNFMDMLLAKLQTNDIYIHINVAGIIIEHDAGAFASVTEHPVHPRYSASAKDPLFVTIPRYLEYFDLPFTQDSIDLIYILTRQRTVEPGAEPGEVQQVFGETWSSTDVFKMRQKYKDIITVPAVLLRFNHKYRLSIESVREIAHAFQIKNDPVPAEMNVEGRCHGIMQESSPASVNCWQWSSKSVMQFREFTQHNKIRCFLLNFPRALHPPGPRAGLSPREQCHCYGYKSYGEQSDEGLRVPTDGCAKPLQCTEPQIGQSPDEPTILPLDGTPCGIDKVCWHRKCVLVRENEPMSHIPNWDLLQNEME